MLGQQHHLKITPLDSAPVVADSSITLVQQGVQFKSLTPNLRNFRCNVCSHSMQQNHHEFAPLDSVLVVADISITLVQQGLQFKSLTFYIVVLA